MHNQFNKPSYLHVLEKEFESRQSQTKGYSLRAFARDISVQAPSLSNVLRGKRGLSFYSAVRVAESLRLTKDQKENFINSVLADKKKQKSKRVASLKKGVTLHESFHDELVSDPIYFAAFSFMSSDIPVKTSKSFAQCFGITEVKANNILARLCAARMLKFQGDVLVPTAESFKSTDGLSSQAVKASHKATLENAIRKIDTVPLEYRDYRSLKLSIDKSEMPRFRMEVKKFLDKFFKASQVSKNKKDIYELSVQLFPLSEIEVSK